MGTLHYSSNNSGGNWWLADDDWKAMEDAGWKVVWVKDNPRYSIDTYNDRWLDALAMDASLETDDPEAGVKKWEALVGQDASTEGCNCCGSPHNFSFEDDKGKFRFYETEVTTKGYWS